MKIEKKAITLIEIMIVIFIIGLIGSVIGVNMKGSLDRGRAFKSEQGSKMIHDALTLRIAEGGATVSKVIKDPVRYLEESGFIKNPEKALKDGWNEKYEIVKTGDGEFIVRSTAWERFLTEKKKMDTDEIQGEYPWAFHFDNASSVDDNETEE
jgi:type II secretory pathway pseudopilin PulG